MSSLLDSADFSRLCVSLVIKLKWLLKIKITVTHLKGKNCFSENDCFEIYTWKYFTRKIIRKDRDKRARVITWTLLNFINIRYSMLKIWFLHLSDFFRLFLDTFEKWNISCHIINKGCHNHQWLQPPLMVSWWALRELRMWKHRILAPHSWKWKWSRSVVSNSLWPRGL